MATPSIGGRQDERPRLLGPPKASAAVPMHRASTTTTTTTTTNPSLLSSSADSPLMVGVPSSISTSSSTKMMDNSHRTSTSTTAGAPPRLPPLAPSAPQHHPSYNVDYFSHPWNEFDLKTSWSLMTKRKKTHVDGIRLENASWRKWMQKKWKLQRIPPEMLRWKKDEDITWLYGPFCPSSGRTYFANTAVLRGHGEEQQEPLAWSTAKTTNPAWRTSVGGPTTPPTPTAKRSVLKSMHQVWVTDLKKFALEVERKMAVKFPAAPPPPSSTTLPIPPSSAAGKVSYALADDLPLHPRHRPDSPANTLLAPGSSRIVTYKSDSDLFQPAGTAAASTAYMDRMELYLLEHMDDGPVLSPSSPTVPPPANSIAAQKSNTVNNVSPQSSVHSQQQTSTFASDDDDRVSLDSGSQTPATGTSSEDSLQRLRKAKLRFSTQVEVVEYPVDSFHPRRRSRKLSAGGSAQDTDPFTPAATYHAVAISPPTPDAATPIYLGGGSAASSGAIISTPPGLEPLPGETAEVEEVPSDAGWIQTVSGVAAWAAANISKYSPF